MRNKLLNLLPVFLLLLVSGVLVYTNYTPGTILSGWDTLHPEFDFGLNLKRLVFGVFRTEQGLGAVAAHSHMAELPRLLILYLLHFFLPLEALRYSFIFLCLILGPLGMYFFLQKHILKEKVPSFLGALFYLLNFGTIQTFAVPFEMFTALYAYLPFVFLYATWFLMDKKNKIKNLVLFSIFILLMSISAYAATLWYVFFISFFIYCFILTFLPVRAHNEDAKLHIENSKPAGIGNLKFEIGNLKFLFVLLLATFIINSYWLLPNIYFVKNHGKSVENASINKLFSQQAFLKNKEFGNAADILLLKNFYFDWPIYEGDGEFGMILSSFINHLENKFVLAASYLIAFFWVLGIIYSIKYAKLKSFPFLILFIFSLFFLINANFPFENLFVLLQEYVPFFKEAMRFPGDKILNIAVFIISIYFAVSQRLFINIAHKILRNKFLAKGIVFAVSSCLLIFTAWPAFQGNMINPYMKIQIPQEYYELFSYMEKQEDKGKVATFPTHSPFGWTFYDFQNKNFPSFQGAGFLYFGIKQPVLERDFDRWNPNNENYYKEISHAVYTNNVNLFANVIKKYDIKFLIVDKNVTSIPNPQDLLYFDQTEKLIKNLNMKYEIKKFSKITVYKIKDAESLVVTKPILTNVFPLTTSMFKDTAYEHYFEYFTYPEQFEHKNNTVYAFFPFRDIADNQFRLNKNLVDVKEDKLVFGTGKKTKNFYLLTEFENSMVIFPSNILMERKDDSIAEISFYPNIAIFDDKTFSSPITGDLTIPDDIETDLYINQKYHFRIKKLVPKVTYALGKAFLDNQDNNISLYSASSMQNIPKFMSKINPTFSSCNEESSKPDIKTYVKDDKVTLSSDDDVCIYLPLKNIISDEITEKYQEILLEQKLQYKGTNIVSACAYSFSDSSCSYYPDIKINNSSFQFSFPIKTDKLENSAIKLFIKRRTGSIKKEEEISDLSLSFAAPYQEALITHDLIKKTFLKNDYIQFSKLVVPRNTQEPQSAEVAKVERFENNCLREETAVKQIVNSNNEDVIKYSAEKGSFCDHFQYKNLPHKQAFLVFIESKNESGLPLTVCITNYTSRRCDVYDVLSNFKEFGSDIFLLPPMDEKGVGYDVNIENIGVRGTPAVNYLKSIEFIPVPYELLQGIKVENKGFKKMYKEKTDAKIIQAKELNPSLLMLSVKNATSRYIINLNYSYEKNFRAYYLTCGNEFECTAKSYLVWVFGKQIKDHVIVNNWSNGWIVDKKLKDNQKIVISYIPQYLEYAGFLSLGGYTLILTFFVLIKTLKKNKKISEKYAGGSKNQAHYNPFHSQSLKK